MLLRFLKIPGLEYEILESSNRVGGRIYTYHFTKEKHQYYDVGAMRYPRIQLMKPLFDLFHRIGVEDRLIKYYHDGIDSAKNTPELYNNILHVTNSSKSHRIKADSSFADKFQNADIYNVGSATGGTVPEQNVIKGATNIMDEIYGPFRDTLDAGFGEGWNKLMNEDFLSARQVLRRSSQYGDNDTIQWLDTMMCDNLMDNYISSVPDIVADGDRWVCIEGGSEVIIQAMEAHLNVKPQLKTRVTTISIDHTTDASNLGMLVQVAREDNPRRYSTVFNTTTLACAQRMDLRGADLSFAQNEAIRSLKYDTSCKIAIRFKTNWWKKAGIVGGEAPTDLPIRLCVYPSYNIYDDPNQPAVMLCSYTWSQDAPRMGSLIGEGGEGKSGVAMFAPGQFQRMIQHLSRPCANGNLHFIGEATSTTHAWVLGALNSAWRGVYQFLQKQESEGEEYQEFWQRKMEALILEFGEPDELEVLTPRGELMS
ncbi:hypothetical protein ONS95_011126 [Cadophora gregata]|uniref:uncharacterized protein n=1 Tax=Cadophora gregata TaxID=51156 RepID=UPI0026DDC2E8|nr:uncharacterized protein ONS95_011126 [Cadophora gregata]KAK0119690.1 hypothetical protein ONS95_011126 [Cadophora gregata]KAK0120725.1 hypothetical protein ONS96_010928 [Cadophora gregata f. sp. sojae]